MIGLPELPTQTSVRNATELLGVPSGGSAKHPSELWRVWFVVCGQFSGSCGVVHAAQPQGDWPKPVTLALKIAAHGGAGQVAGFGQHDGSVQLMVSQQPVVGQHVSPEQQLLSLMQQGGSSQ
jgi:hypothetical protein